MCGARLFQGIFSIFFVISIAVTPAPLSSLAAVAGSCLRDVSTTRLLHAQLKALALLRLRQLSTQLRRALVMMLEFLVELRWRDAGLGLVIENRCCRQRFGCHSCRSCAAEMAGQIAGELGSAEARRRILLFGKLGEQLGVHLVCTVSRIILHRW
jgi:hypothetical protein